MPDTSTPAVQGEPRESTRGAFDRLNPRIMQVEGDTHINVDVMYVALLVRAHEPEIQKLRPEMEAKLKDFDLRTLDDLVPMSRALQHAHGLYLQATKAPAALQNLVDAGTASRELLIGEVGTLARRGLINSDSVREVKRGSSHRQLIIDLQILVQTFRERWDSIKERTGVKLEEIDAAEALIDTLTDAVIVKEYSPAAQAHATVVREKAFLLLARTWGEVRHAVSYVRRNEGDADIIAPSLYGNRNGGKRSASDDEADDSQTAESEAGAPEEKATKGKGAAPAAAQTPSLATSLNEGAPFKRAAGEG